MRREQLEHAIRTACQIIGHPEVVVVGSQAILGTYDESRLPAAATMATEVDILPIADSNEATTRLADRIEGIAGELSPFEELHGFSIDGVDLARSTSRRLAQSPGQGAERQHSSPVRTAAVHRPVPGQRRPLRSQAHRLPREGPQLRGRTSPSRPRRRRPHRVEAPHNPARTPGREGSRDRLAQLAAASERDIT